VLGNLARLTPQEILDQHLGKLCFLGSGGSSNRASIGLRSSVPGETEVCASKWDNHNAIARGFTGMKDNYHPVTFRQIYNVDSQTNKAETTQNL